MPRRVCSEVECREERSGGGGGNGWSVESEGGSDYLVNYFFYLSPVPFPSGLVSLLVPDPGSLALRQWTRTGDKAGLGWLAGWLAGLRSWPGGAHAAVPTPPIRTSILHY